MFLITFLIAENLVAESLTFWNPSNNIGVEVVIPDWALEKKVVSKTENGIKEDGKLYSNIKVYQYDDDPSIWKKFFSIQIEEGVNDAIRVFKDIQLDVYLNYCYRESLKYDLVKDLHVRITIYDLLGNTIKNLFEGNQLSGSNSIQWYGTDNNGYNVSSGTYVYHIKADNIIYTGKMVLIK